MGLHESHFGRVLLGFCFSLLLFRVSICYADDKTIQVVGIGECADCKDKNIKTIHAFSGLHVTIDCKDGNGAIKTRGEGKLDKDGKFTVSLPEEMVKDGKLKEGCYAQLHSASAAPCPTHNGIEASKIVVTKSGNNEKHTLKPVENLKFSTALCTSAFLWPHFKFPPFKFPPIPLLHKPHELPPIPIYKHPDLPPVPVYKPPDVPPVPIYKHPDLPPVPVYKPPDVPPVPIYKPPDVPPVPVYKNPDVPPIPVYKKPLLPHIPLYKPIPPLLKKPFPAIPLFPPSLSHP